MSNIAMLWSSLNPKSKCTLLFLLCSLWGKGRRKFRKAISFSCDGLLDFYFQPYRTLGEYLICLSFRIHWS